MNITFAMLSVIYSSDQRLSSLYLTGLHCYTTDHKSISSLKTLSKFSGVIFVLFLVFRADYYASEYLFRKLCKDLSLIGQHVYEREFVDKSHTRPQTLINGIENVPHDAYYYDGEIELIKTHFDEKFEYKRFQPIQLYRVGPIYLKQSSVVRKSDGKMLSKAAIAYNQQGWLVKLFSFGYQASMCPSLKAEEGELISVGVENHLYLLRDTLIVK